MSLMMQRFLSLVLLSSVAGIPAGLAQDEGPRTAMDPTDPRPVQQENHELIKDPTTGRTIPQNQPLEEQAQNQPQGQQDQQPPQGQQAQQDQQPLQGQLPPQGQSFPQDQQPPQGQLPPQGQQAPQDQQKPQGQPPRSQPQLPRPPEPPPAPLPPPPPEPEPEPTVRPQPTGPKTSEQRAYEATMETRLKKAADEISSLKSRMDTLKGKEHKAFRDSIRTAAGNRSMARTKLKQLVKGSSADFDKLKVGVERAFTDLDASIHRARSYFPSTDPR